MLTRPPLFDIFFCTPYPPVSPACVFTPPVVRTPLDVGDRLFWNPYTDREDGEGEVWSREEPCDMLLVLLW